MLAESVARVEALPSGHRVLDIGGWAKPLRRADWVIDLLPYETRGMYGEGTVEDRFRAETWVQRDVCDQEPWPFEDDYFDFVVCSHTLEDIRDPVRVCHEMSRVARAGYVEVPSIREELSHDLHGPWVGWAHHRWICDLSAGRIEFVMKPHSVHGRPDLTFARRPGEADRIQSLWWEGGIEAAENILIGPGSFEEWVRARAGDLPGFGSGAELPPRGGSGLRRRLQALRRRR